MNRKRIVEFGVIVAVILVVAGAIGDAGEDTAAASAQRLEGTWRFTVEVTGLPAGFALDYTSLITFVPGGGLIQTAWIPPGTGGLAGVAGVSPWIGHGEWVRTGSRRFTLTVLIPRFDGKGNFVGLGKTRASITLATSNQSATGLYEADLLDANENVLITGFGGTVSGTRIEVEPVR
jgi:hypothetical protein